MNSNGSSADSSTNRDYSTDQNSSSQNFQDPEPETIEMRFNKILIQSD